MQLVKAPSRKKWFLLGFLVAATIIGSMILFPGEWLSFFAFVRFHIISFGDYIIFYLQPWLLGVGMATATSFVIVRGYVKALFFGRNRGIGTTQQTPQPPPPQNPTIFVQQPPVIPVQEPPKELEAKP